MRIGFVLESFYIPAWAYEAIAKAMGHDNVIPCLMILKQSQTQPSSILHKLNQYLYRQYFNINQRFFNTRNQDAFALKDIRTLFPETQVLEISSSNGFNKRELETIRETKPDILFCITKQRLDGDILDIPTYGVWAYHHGDVEKYRGQPSGFWELYHGEHIIGATLLRLTHSIDTDEIYARILIPCHTILLSYNYAAWNSACLLSLSIDRLIKTKSPYLQPRGQIKATGQIYSMPNGFHLLLLLGKLMCRCLKNPPKLTYNEWSIQVAKANHKSTHAQLEKNIFTPLSQPPGRFWADPYVFHWNGKDYVFFEELEYDAAKGVINVAEINDQGLVSAAKTILKENNHFSNPYVFKENDTIYLLPEQAETNEVALYQSIQFPDQWQKVGILLKDGYYVDPILLKKDGIWWLFCCEKTSTHGSPDVFGKLFYADHLLGPWQEHPQSPISMDCRFSRSAGAIFFEEGQAIRVVQDFSYDYGYQIHYLKITELTKSTYQEQWVRTISPEALGVEGMHTINSTETLTVIDTRKTILNPQFPLFKRVKRLFSSILRQDLQSTKHTG